MHLDSSRVWACAHWAGKAFVLRPEMRGQNTAKPVEALHSTERVGDPFLAIGPSEPPNARRLAASRWKAAAFSNQIATSTTSGSRPARRQGSAGQPSTHHWCVRRIARSCGLAELASRRRDRVAARARRSIRNGSPTSTWRFETVGFIGRVLAAAACRNFQAVCLGQSGGGGPLFRRHAKDHLLSKPTAHLR